MLSYENIKKTLIEQKPKIFLGVGFVLVFVVGFGAGKFKENKYSATVNIPHYYSTNSNTKVPNKQTSKAKIKATQKTATGTIESNNVPVSPSLARCIIKGNISSDDRKIYHMSGDAFYKTVHPEECFKTEKEAQAAGFKKSGR